LDLKVCAPSLSIRADAPVADLDAGAANTRAATLTDDTTSSRGAPDASIEEVETDTLPLPSVIGESSATTAQSTIDSEPILPAASGERQAADADAAALALPEFWYESMGILWKTWLTDVPERASNCAVMRTDSDANACDYAWHCDEHEYSVHCDGQEDGFACMCSYPDVAAPYGYLGFSVPTSNAEVACLAAFDACTTPRSEQACATRVSANEKAKLDLVCTWEANCMSTAESVDVEVS